MFKIGDKITEFSMDMYHNGDIKKFKLSDHFGKWLVLFFYPGDFSFVCPTELEEVANLHNEFTKLGADVFSISQDSPFVHKAWHESSKNLSKIKFPMLSDVTAEFCKAFGAYSEKDLQPLRSTFIIDPNRILISSEMNDNTIGRSINETIRKLQAAIFVKENKGQLCPVNWVPGKESIKLPTFTIFN